MAAQTLWVMGEAKQETSQTIWVLGEPMDKIGSVETAAAAAEKRIINISKYNIPLFIGTAIAIIIARNPKLTRRNFFNPFEWLE